MESHCSSHDVFTLWNIYICSSSLFKGTCCMVHSILLELCWMIDSIALELLLVLADDVLLDWD